MDGIHSASSKKNVYNNCTISLPGIKFRCSSCEELLVDLLYFYSPDEDNILCGRHHGETFVPRCVGCDEVCLLQSLSCLAFTWKCNVQTRI